MFGSGEELEKDCLSYFASAEILFKAQEEVQEQSPEVVEMPQEEVEAEGVCCIRACAAFVHVGFCRIDRDKHRDASRYFVIWVAV